MRDTLRAVGLRAVAALLRPPSDEQGMSTQQRILLIRPDHLGDILFLTPTLHALRRAQPTAHITALVGPWAAPLLTSSPHLDAVETVDFPWFDRRPAPSRLEPYARLYATAAQLRGRFDVAVILRFDHWWGGWLAAAAGIPRRIGYATPQLQPFLSEPVPYRAGRHEVVQNLTLTARLGTPETATPQSHPLWFMPGATAREAAVAWSGEAAATVAMHPGSGAPVKRWPTAQWAALGRHLVLRHHARVIITGAAVPEVDEARKIAALAGVPLTVAAGQTSLETLAALYARCDLVVGPDTGPLHLAVAVRTPTVHLYGPVSPQLFGPWGDPDRHVVLTRGLACQYCHRLDWSEEESRHHPCVYGLPLRWVLAAVDRQLDNGRGRES